MIDSINKIEQKYPTASESAILVSCVCLGCGILFPVIEFLLESSALLRGPRYWASKSSSYCVCSSSRDGLLDFASFSNEKQKKTDYFDV